MLLVLLGGCGGESVPPVEPPLDVPAPRDMTSEMDSLADRAETLQDSSLDAAEALVTTCPLRVIRALTLPMDTAMGSLGGASSNPSLGCARTTPGPEDYYLLRVSSRTGVVISTTSPIDTALALRRMCADTRSELACNDDASPSGRNAQLRATLDPGEYYLVVDQVGGADGAAAAGGAYTLTVSSGNFADHAACGSALPLSDGATLSNQDLSMASQTQSGCFPFATGPMLFYRTMVPAGETLTVTVTPSSGSAMFVPAVRFLPSCAALQCIAQGVGSASGTTTAWTNYSDSAQALVVAVSGAMGASAGRYDISAAIGRGSRNATCSRATLSTDGANFRGQSFADAMDILPPCTGSTAGVTAGPALYYRATVPPGQSLTATVTPSTGTGLAPVSRILSACGEAACLAESGRPTVSGAHGTRWLNSSSAPREVLIAVQAYPATSTTVTFDVGFVLRAPPTNALCARAQVLSETAPAVGVNTLDGVETAPACTDGITGGPVLYYQVSVPPGRMLVATSTRIAGASDQILRAFSACGGPCTASSGRALTTTPAVLRYPNPGASPQNVFLALSSATTSQTLTADLAIQFRSVASNALCTGATAVTDGTMLRAQDTSIATDQRGACTGTTSVSGPQLYYQTTLLPNQILSATLTPTAGAGPWVIRMYPACAATTCLATSNRTSGVTPATGRFVNGPTAQTVILALGADSAGVTGTFDLSVSIRTAPTYNVCAMARSVSSGETLRAENSLDGRELPPACPGITSVSGALYYSITVPPGQILLSTLRRGPGTAWTPNVRVLQSCGGTCRDALVSRLGADTLSLFRNAMASSERAVVAVNSTSATVGGLFDLGFQLIAPPSNTSCASAARVSHGSLLSSLPVGEAPSAPSVCAGTVVSRALYYRATIPPGATLTAFASQPVGTSAFTPTLQVLSGCASPSCLSAGAALMGGSVARHMNSGTTALEVILAVGAPAGFSPSLVDLQVFIEQRPYSLSMVSSGCDDLRAGTVVPEVIAGASPSRALPFAFRYFSESVTHWTASYTGYLQLWPNASGVGNVAPANLPLPSPTAPSRLLGPHWDSITARTGTFRFLEFAGAPRRVTFEWSDVTALGATLSFQVKLFEGSEVIEFHYCRLDPVGSPLASGSSATVGMQDGTGLRAVQHAYNTVGAVNTSSALRFTPTAAP